MRFFFFSSLSILFDVQIFIEYAALQGHSLPSSTTVVHPNAISKRSDSFDAGSSSSYGSSSFDRHRRFVDFRKIGKAVVRLLRTPPGNPGYVFPPPG